MSPICASEFLFRSFEGVPNQVEEVELIHCKFFCIEELDEWPSLKSLKVYCFEFMLSKPIYLSDLVGLERLELKHLNLFIEETGLIGMLQNSSCSLQSLTTSDCHTSIDQVLHRIGSVKTLKNLDITGAEVGEDGLEGLISATTSKHSQFHNVFLLQRMD